MTVFFMAARSLLLQRKRYTLIFITIVVGFALITVLHAATSGVLETVKTKAARYFAGHISITGYRNSIPYIAESAALIDRIEAIGLPIRTVAARTVYYYNNAALFFAGRSIRQRRFIGIDFNLEAQELANLQFLEGSLEGIIQDGRDGILISEAAAKLLGARVGDDIMLSLTNDSGQYSTSTLFVRGIFRETSLFGYSAYIRRQDLNRLLQQPPDFATDIAIYARQGVDHNRLMVILRAALADEFRLLPPLPTKAALNAELLANDWSLGPVLAPLTLDAHLNQITVMLDAFWAVTWFILVVFILVVMVGILNTYRVLVYERTREIGTMRALGMQHEAVRGMFLIEAALLALVASMVGFGLGVILLRFVGWLELSSVSGAGLVTDQGHLSPFIDVRLVCLTLVMMVGAVVLAASGPATRASRVSPAEALRATN